MKKSLFYGIPAALMLAALLAGCPQSADDDDGAAPKPVNTPGTDLSYIAYAFGYGIDSVQVIQDIYLEGNELVVPAGKTLDFQTNDRSIRGITGNSKIIVQGNGNILFGANQKQLDFTGRKGAKIIAGKEFINRYVYVDYGDAAAWEKAEIPSTDRPGLSAKADAKILANWQQIALIDTFDNFKSYGSTNSDGSVKKGYIFIDEASKVANSYKYVAVSAPSGEIKGEDVYAINDRAGGLRLYLVGEPVKFNFTSKDYTLDLSGSVNIASYYKHWAPAEGEKSLFNVSADADGSLAIAGNVYITNGQIKAPGGFTVWGAIDNSGVGYDSTTITADATQVTAWTAFLYGADFKGSVKLRGSVPNVFGGLAEFGGDVEISGPATFESGTFNGNAQFNSPVVFSSVDQTDKITFKGDVTFADDAQLYANVSFNPEKKNTYYKSISGISYSVVKTYLTSAGGADSKVEITGAKFDDDTEYDANVVFAGESVTVGTEAAFTKDVTFQGDVTFSKIPTFGSWAVVGSAASNVVIKGLATFDNGAYFGTAGAVEAGSAVNNVSIEKAVFTGGSIAGNVALSLGDPAKPAIVFDKGEGNSGGTINITIPSGGGISFQDDTLTFSGNGGTISGGFTLNNATVQVEPESKMNLSQGGVSFELLSATGTAGGGFTITGNAVLDAGAITGLGSTPATVKGVGGIVLQIPANQTLTVKNALVDISDAGGIVFAGTKSRIYIKDNGNLVTANSSALTGNNPNAVGVIIAGSNSTNGSVSLLTGSVGSNKDVGTRSGGTEWSLTEATTTEFVNLLSGKDGFVSVGTEALAGSIIVHTNATAPSDGPIAVFIREDWK